MVCHAVQGIYHYLVFGNVANHARSKSKKKLNYFRASDMKILVYFTSCEGTWHMSFEGFKHDFPSNSWCLHSIEGNFFWRRHRTPKITTSAYWRLVKHASQIFQVFFGGFIWIQVWTPMFYAQSLKSLLSWIGLKTTKQDLCIYHP